MNTLRERILASSGLAPVAVPCPEWGEDVVVHIHPLSGDDRDGLEEESTELASESGYTPGAGRKRLHARAVVRAARDAEGKRLFQLGDVEALAAKDARVLDRLSAVSEEEVQALLGKPVAPPGDVSSSGSATSST